jgi:subtilase family serine protease
MNASLKIALALIAAFAISACSSGGGSTSVPGTNGTNAATAATKPFAAVKQITASPQWLIKGQARPECPQVTGRPTCLALRGLKNGVVPAACNPSSSCGFTPAQIQSVYGLNKKNLAKGAGIQVAIIEAGDYADATADIGTYRTQYKLPAANIVRYNQDGQTSNLPESCEDFGWCVETALDFDMVSATCPNCTIDLMEADGSIAGFEAANQAAVKLGAKIISNSWICYGNWDCGDSNFPNSFSTKGIAYLASSGDEAYNEIGGPSVLSTVIAVGGTQLETSGKKFTETAWNDAGSGCETSVSKPSWQSDPGCSGRTDSDVSAEAGCQPGVAMYSGLYGGWFFECGTSVASPLLGGVVALAGNRRLLNGGQWVWSLDAKQKTNRLHVISSGSNGSCGGSYLCTAGTNQFGVYSGPSGWGTPIVPRAL